MRRLALTAAAAGVGLVLGACWLGWERRGGPPPSAAAPAICSSNPASVGAEDGRTDGGKASDRIAGRSFQLPTEVPVGLSCPDVRRVIAQARLHFAAEPEPVDPRALADATVDWLDPHGLWSASPDAPLPAFLHKRE